jgi:hypothetical protein
MLEAVGSIAVSQLSRPEGKSSSSNSINVGVGFGYFGGELKWTQHT